MTKQKTQLRRGPKPKPEGEKKVPIRIFVKKKNLKAATAETTAIAEKYGSYNS